MLAHIKGRVLYHQDQKAVIQLDQGLGYEVHLGDRQMLFPQQEVELHLATIIREQEHTLYGFYTLEQKIAFNLMLQVKGVGPKTAFNILQAVALEDLSFAILQEQEKFFSSLPGVGSKTAKQIILDLRPQFLKKNPLSTASHLIPLPRSTGAKVIGSDKTDKTDKDKTENINQADKTSATMHWQDFREALSGLGFNDQDIYARERRVREHLQQLSPQLVPSSAAELVTLALKQELQ
jgi:Holliday junction DNA helicase RuvA subunit